MSFVRPPSNVGYLGTDPTTLSFYPDVVTTLLPTYVQLVSSPHFLTRVAGRLPFPQTGGSCAGYKRFSVTTGIVTPARATPDRAVVATIHPMTGDQEHIEQSSGHLGGAGSPLMTGFIELMERAQREAQELHEDARRTLQSAREEASRVRAEANAEADLVRQQAGIDAEFLRRDAERLWSAFSRLLAAASEVVNIIGPMVPAPTPEVDPGTGPLPGEDRGEPLSEGLTADAADTGDPAVTSVSEEDLSEAERELRGLLENH